MNKRKKIDFRNSEASEDINIKAFTEAFKKGKFKSLPSATFVAFVDGVFSGCASNRHELLRKLYAQGIRKKIYYKKLNGSEHIFSFPSLRKTKSKESSK